MNCYVCQVETGNCSHPALAICQRCGAGVCDAHVVEIKMIAATGMAGTARYLLICSRCYAGLSQERSPRSRRPAQEKDAPAKPAGKHWWNRFRQSRSKEAEPMEPAEVVKEVERFLQQQRRQGVDHFRETDGER